MIHACVQRFNMTENLEIFFGNNHCFILEMNRKTWMFAQSVKLHRTSRSWQTMVVRPKRLNKSRLGRLGRLVFPYIPSLFGSSFISSSIILRAIHYIDTIVDKTK
jgi:hypothetical protein